MNFADHKTFFKAKESRECCPDCDKMVVYHFRTTKQKKLFNKKQGWPDSWIFDYDYKGDCHRFLFFDVREKQNWIEANFTIKDPSIFGDHPTKDQPPESTLQETIDRFIENDVEVD